MLEAMVDDALLQTSTNVTDPGNLLQTNYTFLSFLVKQAR